MTRRLLIVDCYDTTAFERLAQASAPEDRCDVLLLGLSADWFEWRHAARLPGSSRWQILDPGPFADEAWRLVAAFVVDFIPRLPRLDLGGTTLARLLDRPDGSDWWFMETSEKGPYRGPLVGQLYRLALIRLAVQRGVYDEVWHGVEEAALAALLKREGRGVQWNALAHSSRSDGPPLVDWPLIRYWGQALRAAAWLVLARVVSRTIRAVPPPSGAELTFTVFPAWWSGADTASPADRFFSLRGTARPQGYLAWLTEPRRLWRHRAHLRRAFRARGIVPLQQFLGLRDLVSVFSPAAYFRVRTFERRLRGLLRAEFAGFDIRTLIGREVSRSLSSHEPFQDRLLQRAVRRAALVIRPAYVQYRAEFQPVEHALLRGLEQAGGGAPGLGFVHFPFGERYLSMRFSAEEGVAGSDLASVFPRPMPHGILAIGPSAARHAAGGGYPADRVAVCGPQRYGRLMDVRQRVHSRGALRQRVGLPADRMIVFVALAIMEADTEALCAALAKVSGALDDILLVVRTHPNRPRNDGALGVMLSDLGPDGAMLMPAGADLYDAMAAADVMVCIGSMIAFEAMALGVMPILFENPSTYPATSLAEYQSGLFIAHDGRGLIEAIEAVRVQSMEARQKRLAWPALLNDVFGDLARPLREQMDDALRVLGVVTASGNGGQVACGGSRE